jgi:hypothetical protein
MQTDTLTPAEMARLSCVAWCPLRALGCQDTPPVCARYGSEYDANAVYVAEMERRLTVEAPRVDWVCAASVEREAAR